MIIMCVRYNTEELYESTLTLEEAGSLTQEFPTLHLFVKDEDVYGYCRNCGAVETKLVKQDGTRNYSDIGESVEYPTGYGCELCD